jgi:hypothetical protein
MLFFQAIHDIIVIIFLSVIHDSYYAIAVKLVIGTVTILASLCLAG